jgi:gas vesicle protein
MTSHESERWSSIKWLSTFLVGLLFGGLAGALAMWLLAPSTGKKTRSQIQKQGAKLRHEVAASVEETATEVSDKAHQFTDSVHEGVGELQQHAQDMLGAVKK